MNTVPLLLNLGECNGTTDHQITFCHVGGWACPSNVSPTYKASEASLPWVDWILTQELIDKRNELGHKAEVVSLNDCIRYVDAIERELQAWNII